MRTLLVPTLLASLLAVAPTSLRGQQADSAARRADSALTRFSPTHRAAVERLMRATRVREQLEATSDEIPALKGLPTPPGLKEDMRMIQTEFLSWAIIGTDVTRAYLETYSESEANALADFYATPLGQLLLERAPRANARVAEVTSAQMQKALPKLMERAQARMGIGP